MSEPKAVMLFDGVCNFCNRSVRFVMKHDRRAFFRFAALQSPAGERLQKQYGFDPAALDAFILIERGRAYERSAAALRVMRRLAFPWSLAWTLRFVPRPVLDFAYDQFARRRYRWFGRRSACMVPGERVRARFVPE